jgi:hypothetical protein
MSAVWAISSTTVAALLAVVCIILAACLFILLKMYHNGTDRLSSKSCLYIISIAIFDLMYYSETTEKEIEMKQNEVYGISTRPL